MRTAIIINNDGPTYRTAKDINDHRYDTNNKMCKGKIKNPTKEKAEAQVQRLLIGFKSVTHAYLCPLCGAWHVGHTDAERRRTNEMRRS
jgi:hypothetical protein